MSDELNQADETIDIFDQVVRERDELRLRLDEEHQAFLAEQVATQDAIRECDELRAENKRLKHYETDFKKLTIQHCGPKCACVQEQRQDLEDADRDVELLQAVVKRQDDDIERLRAENRGLTETIGEWQEIHGTFDAQR